MESLNEMCGWRRSYHECLPTISRVVPATRLGERARLGRLDIAGASIAHRTAGDRQFPYAMQAARNCGNSLLEIRYPDHACTRENEVQTP